MSRHLTDPAAPGGDAIGTPAEMTGGDAYVTGHKGSGPPVGRMWPLAKFFKKDAANKLAEPINISHAAGNVSITTEGNTTGNILSDFLVTRSGTVNYGVGQGANLQLGNTTSGKGVIIQGAAGVTQFFRNVSVSGWLESVRITENGEFCLGVTAASVSTIFSILAPVNGISLRVGNGNAGMYMSNTSGTAAWQPFSFNNNGNAYNQIGSITCSSTAAAYNTSSDYRLKDDIVDLTDSGEFIDALRPRKGIWKNDESEFVGFIAHEFAEVSPSSVNGEKDAMQDREIVDPESGETRTETLPAYQSMQASSSEVMAHIIAELQSLRKRVAELEGV